MRSQDVFFGKVIACGKREVRADAPQADAPQVTCEGDDDAAAIAVAAASGLTITGCVEARDVYGLCSEPAAQEHCCASCAPGTGSVPSVPSSNPCASTSSIAEQKDTLELADVDYGSSGAFTINVWFKHDQENFEDFNREQFFGHGDPTGWTAGSPNQLHWQFEKNGNIRTLAVDGTDAVADNCPYCNGGAGGSAGTMAIEAATGELCYDNPKCSGPYRGFTATLASDGAVDDGASWHMLTLTTHPDGSRGYRTYIDGQMRASMPYEGMGVDIFDTDPDGNWVRESNVRLGRPIDPEGPMRFCGRLSTYGGLKQGYWGAQNEYGLLGFHPNRYFMGKVAHASFFSHAMTEEQVNALMASYVKQYNLLPTPPSPPRSPPSPP